MSEIPLEIAMHAERLYDEGGYESVPTIIAKAILAERNRCAKIAEDFEVKYAPPPSEAKEYTMTPKQERLLLYVMVLAMICFWLWLAVWGVEW